MFDAFLASDERPPHKELTAYGCWISPLTRFTAPLCGGLSSAAARLAVAEWPPFCTVRKAGSQRPPSSLSPSRAARHRIGLDVVPGLTPAAAASKSESYNSAMTHIVLLGDSVFDNASYVPGGPSVLEWLRRCLPRGSQATLLAVNGACVSNVSRQLARVPADATHLIVGRRRQRCPRVRGPRAARTGGFLPRGAVARDNIRAEFEREFRRMVTEVVTLEKTRSAMHNLRRDSRLSRPNAPGCACSTK